MKHAKESAFSQKRRDRILFYFLNKTVIASRNKYISELKLLYSDLAMSLPSFPSHERESTERRIWEGGGDSR